MRARALPATPGATRESYRDAAIEHLWRAVGEEHPGQFVPFPGDGIRFLLIYVALALSECDDDVLHDLALDTLDAVNASWQRQRDADSLPAAAGWASKRATKAPRFRVLEGGRATVPVGGAR